MFRSVVVVCCDNFYILSLSQLFVNNFLKLFCYFITSFFDQMIDLKAISLTTLLF
ncbi:hypothetical protein D2A77_07590 [Enterococcus faecalis]|nr:hypothetical protein [Enterococcus faecalis]EGO8589050.1 hypothetical protein [Enterococcus faecalis]EGO8995917.1 hypothetical protein [Enterococcus faecalis]EGO9071540.1 hypothetical protein [Enterococcus faecalis]PQE41296.1 hypothetical protein CUS13_12970 [Enterococcus faecalis]